MLFITKKTENQHNVLVQDDNEKTLAIITDRFGINGDWRIFTADGRPISSKVKGEYDSLMSLEQIKERLFELGENNLSENNPNDYVIVIRTEFGLTYFFHIDEQSGGYPMLSQSSFNAKRMTFDEAYKLVKEFKETGTLKYCNLEYQGDKMISVDISVVIHKVLDLD